MEHEAKTFNVPKVEEGLIEKVLRIWHREGTLGTLNLVVKRIR
jgi:hypothetical protein